MFLKDQSLAGKRVVVTAGANGIGRAIAEGFAQNGAKVLICDVDQVALSQMLSDLPGLTGLQADVSDEASVASLFQAVDTHLGGLDVMINNAGIAGPTGMVEDLGSCAPGRPCRD